MSKKISSKGLTIYIIVLCIIIIIEAILVIVRINKKSEPVAEDENSYFVLYKGTEIQLSPGLQNLKETRASLNDSLNKKYNTTYYNYENNKACGETEGNFKYSENGENKVTNVARIAVSKDINLLTREVERLEEIPEGLEELEDYTDVEIDHIDTDGDGTKEYMVCVKNEKEKTKKQDAECYSAITLYTEDFSKVSDLVILDDGNVDGENHFLSLDMIEYADIDNDLIMEMLIEIPSENNDKVSIFKYSQCMLAGEKVELENLDF